MSLKEKKSSNIAFAVATFVLPTMLFRPLQIYFDNSKFIDLPLLDILFYLLILCLFAFLCLFLLVFKLKNHSNHLTALLIASSFCTYLNYEIIWSQYSFDFQSQNINWDDFGILPYLELFALLIIFFIMYFLCRRPRIAIYLSISIIFISFISFAVSIKFDNANTLSLSNNLESSKNDIFGLSSELNIIHLFPDAVQLDIAKQVLIDDPILADKFEGFIFFSDNISSFPGTAPSIISVFNGRNHDLRNGYYPNTLKKEMEVDSYQAKLSKNGFRLDYASITPLYCPGGPSSCLNVQFNDLRSRSYSSQTKDLPINIALLFDLSIFRQVPLKFKMNIFNEGKWLFSDLLANKKLKSISQTHAPVLKEWSKKMHINGSRPTYKFYHWIGAHTPPQWDSNCNYIGTQKPSRSAFYEQTKCTLKKISEYVEELKKNKLFDKTIIVISSDHGNAIKPVDLIAHTYNPDLRENLLGHSRSLLMIKPFNKRGKLYYSANQSTLIDIAPTILQSVGINHNYKGLNIIDSNINSRSRDYYKYRPGLLSWTKLPTNFDHYKVIGDANNLESWNLNSIFVNEPAPTKLSTKIEADYRFMRGVSNKWIYSNELFFLIRRQDSGPHEISFQLHVPEKIKDQTIELSVNNIQLPQTKKLTFEKTTFWQTVTFCISDNLISKTDNFFKLKFSQTHKISETHRGNVSAKLNTIESRTSTNCSS